MAAIHAMHEKDINCHMSLLTAQVPLLSSQSVYCTKQLMLNRP